MGTKVKTNAFLPEYHPVIDLDGNTTNGKRFSYHDDQIVKTGHDPDLFISRMFKYAQLGHNTEKVRQTILTHESIFKNQLQELHRIYRRQRDLMNEVKRREIKSNPEILKSNLCFNQVGVNIANQTDGIHDIRPAIDRGNATLLSNSQLALQDLFRNSLDGMSGKQHMFNGHAAIEDFCSAKSPAFSQLVLAEPKNEFLRFPLDIGKALSRKKRKLFGVEISEGDDCSCDAASIMSSTVLKNDLINFDAFSKKESISRTQVENVNGGLPWFLRNPQDNNKLSKGMKSSYIMNLDSLQENSRNFFKKCEEKIGPSQNLDQKNEILVPMPSQNDKDMSADKFLVDVDCAREVKNDEIYPRNNHISDLRHHIDLNLPLDEEDASSAPFLSTAFLKIGTTEINFEAPPVIESEPNTSPKEQLEMFSEECDKNAADALIGISLFGQKNPPDEGACEPSEAEPRDCLEWFAEIIFSQFGDTTSVHVNPNGVCETRTRDLQPGQNGTRNEEDYIPDGMDYFEFMTLNTKEIKEDHKFYNPVALNNPSGDEAGPGATSSERPPRRHSRRGRHRKDFQKDIFPGLVTLSRHEVNEDFHAFDEICKAEGSNSRLSQRKGRGKTRLGGPITSGSVKPHCSTRIEMLFTREMGLEERSLTGWGKRTRRLPRQRCPNSYNISFPVKC